MAVYALGERMPTIHPDAFVHPDAVVIGAVALGPEATVWPGAVLRGDYGSISVGARTSIQDGAVIHATSELATVIGADCVIGHLAHLEGCVVEDGCLDRLRLDRLAPGHVRSGALVGSRRGRLRRHRGPGPSDGPRGAGQDPRGRRPPGRLRRHASPSTSPTGTATGPSCAASTDQDAAGPLRPRADVAQQRLQRSSQPPDRTPRRSRRRARSPTAPASRAISPPAARSHGCRPLSK